MSKWALLRAAASGRRDYQSSSSIHSFSGFADLLPKAKTIWSGFKYCRSIALQDACLDEELNARVRMIIDECRAFMERIDITECLLELLVTRSPDASEASGMCDAAHEAFRATASRLRAAFEHQPHVRLHQYGDASGTHGVNISLFIAHPDYSPRNSAYAFWRYELPPLQQDRAPLLLLTREAPVSSKVSSRSLLSNRIFNVDNTGNICVWPAASVLLHTLLTSERYASLLGAMRGQRVLELGGGSTGLVGLGLAAAGACHDVIVSDGHPDCVANQVRG